MKRSVVLLLLVLLSIGAKAQSQAKHPPTEKTDARVKDRGGRRDRHRKAKWISANQRKQSRKMRAKKMKGH